MSPEGRPDIGDSESDVKVARTDDGVTFREVGSAEAWIFVADESDLASVET